eukprot:CAMPEP_0194366064 /NCGR_PEP_ID=MMETSP0174-20130528/14070_1 /TAXON_ID=216777 /ORGANISM="Proboscia alata, Strain PI-D3" /LENGTH=432 /DNA_ID=CAMNT_0039141041 /DNA_START=140 /DNA_END=1438 /DNA_ORIENTATION=+
MRTAFAPLICGIYIANVGGNPNDPDEFEHRMLRNSLDIDPRTIITKSTPGDFTYSNLRALGGGLRFDWTNLYDHTVMSPLARVIDYYQNPPNACARPVAKTNVNLQRLTIPSSGLGSSLHLYARHLCHAYDQKEVLVLEYPTAGVHWEWTDQRYCSAHDAPLACYFGNHESLRACDFTEEEWYTLTVGVPIDQAMKTEWNYFDTVGGCTFVDRDFESFARADGSNVPAGMTPRDFNQHIVDDHRTTLQQWNAAAMEYLFQSVKPIVVQEAHRQLLDMFPRGIVPPNLVTVHIRWGDKGSEMELAGISEYLVATQTIIGVGWDTEPQHIYLATEDPLAIQEFKAQMSPNWTVYVSGPTTANAKTTGPGKGAVQTEGQDGLDSLAALLISLEADKYVLTTESNWSRLINELRKNVVDRRCGDCTVMFDVRPGEW